MSRKPSEPDTCPVHGVERIEAPNPVGPGRLRYCPVEGCTVAATLVRGKPAQFKLPGLEPGVQQNRAQWREKQTEAEVDALCRQHGIEALTTTVQFRMQTCPQCGCQHRPQGGYNASKGVPDRILLPDWMPPGLGLLLELKGSETPLSREQRDLAARGKILVARSGEEAEALIAEVRKRLRGE